MKTYCQECLKKNDASNVKCPQCGHEMVKTISDEGDIRRLVQKLHKKTNDLRHYLSHTLSFLVIGAILLIIAFFFYYLSFSSSVNKTTGEKVYIVNTSCSEFWVSMVALAIGGVLFVIGVVLSLIIARKKRQILSDIEHIRDTGDLSSIPVKPLIVVLFLKMVASIKHLVWLIKYKRANKAKKEGE